MQKEKIQNMFIWDNINSVHVLQHWILKLVPTKPEACEAFKVRGLFLQVAVIKSKYNKEIGFYGQTLPKSLLLKSPGLHLPEL